MIQDMSRDLSSSEEQEYLPTEALLRHPSPNVRIKAIRQLQSINSEESSRMLMELLYDGDQRVVLATMQALQARKLVPAVSLVNALFLSSTSDTLDKICLDMITQVGDQQSRHILAKKFPVPETVSMTLMPHYIAALGKVGEEQEVETLAHIANNFWGLFQPALLDALERIIQRLKKVEVSEKVVDALQKLYDDGDHQAKTRVLNLSPSIHHPLIQRVLICGIQNEYAQIRMAAVSALGAIGTPVIMGILERYFREEEDEEVLEEFARWLLPTFDERPRAA